jgi:MSHA pilin protein MshD
MSRGFILIEASISYIVLSLALVALVPMFILSLRANKASEKVAVAVHLSQELLEEVRLHRWDQATPTPSVHIAAGSALGLDGGESGADKRTFNDIDDFNGWTESPPMDPVMRPLTSFSTYSRSVTISYLNASFQTSGTPTDLKKVAVCTSAPKLIPVCLDTILANR